MLNKADAIAGNKIVIKDIIKNGVQKDGFMDAVNVYASVKDAGMGNRWKVGPGTELIIVDRPKKKGDAGNVCKVELPTGQQGYVYWCELKISSKLKE